jgi:hypothetical protein
MHRIMLAFAVMWVGGPGAACSQLEPFEIGQIAGAELVVLGEVTDYRDLGTAWGAALVTVRVTESMKGRLAGEVTFVWNGGMAQGPHESRATGRVLIGAMKGGRIAVTTMVPDERPDLPSIVQPYCGEVWMIPAADDTVSKARTAME